MAEHVIAQLGSRYHEWVRAHPQAAADFAAEIEEVLSDAGVTFDRVSARVKTWSSLKAKARKRRPDGGFTYPNPWEDVHDLVGVRVTVFHSTEIPKALEVLGGAFDVLRSVDKAAETRVAGGFGYGSHHLIVTVPENSTDLAPYAGLTFEIQVRTVLQHAWAEFEHDVRYKQGPEPLDPRVDRAFTLAAGLIELADQQFDQIAELKAPKLGSDHLAEIEITPQTLPGILAVLLGNRFPPSRFQDYRWLDELLSAHDLSTVSELSELLNDSAIDKVTAAIRYRFPPGQVRLVDDLLLLRFKEKHIELTGDTGARSKNRSRRLRTRLKTLDKTLDKALDKRPEK